MSNTTTTTIFTKGFYTIERRENEDTIEIVEVCVMPVSGRRHESVTPLPKTMKANLSDEAWKKIEDAFIKAACDGVPSEEQQQKMAENDHKPIVLSREAVRKMGKAVCIRGRWCRDYSGTIISKL